MHPAFVWILRPSRVALFALGILAAGACAPDEIVLPALRLVDLRPRERSSVYLNEPLVLHFSDELDRASISAQSVRIWTREGKLASGTRFVVGRELTFVPDPVRAPDLLDGGYLPNTTYLVELAGFPRADALRSKAGACLPSTLRIDFRTVAVENPRSGSPLFIDDTSDRALPLLLSPIYKGKSTIRMKPHLGIQLEGEEPIDPSTLSDKDFVLVGDDASGTAYPLRVHLEENYNKRAFPHQGTTKVVLLPLTIVPKGDYRLEVSSSTLHLRDFSGHQIPVIGRDGLKQLIVHVMEASPGDIDGEYLEEFLNPEMRSSALVRGVDGTAVWSSSGRVEVRFPAAAGDGVDGDRSFGPTETLQRLAAQSLFVPADTTTKLDGGSGLCVLASQGALEIAGRLQRLGEAQPALFPLALPGETLSDWLERQNAGALPLTVLIAGADLRISGELDVPGPLLLVAGGRVRISGRIRIAGGEPVGASYFKGRGEGGAIALSIDTTRGVRTEIADAGLTLDPPRINPLLRPLVYAVSSTPVPREGHVVRWLSSEGPQGRAGAGKLRVRYIGERRFADAAGNFEVEVDDPALLVDCPTLRVVLQLEVLVGGKKDAPWDPPAIDSVRIRWESQ